MAPQLLAGTTVQGDLNTYTIVQPLGGQIYEQVYLAFYDKNGRRINVAIKDIDGQRYQVEQDIHGELNSLLELDHLCLPRVIESFVQGDRYFMVMEYIAGDTLQEYIDGSQRAETPQRPALKAIVLPLLNVLMYLHTSNPPRVHRDIKPKNIVLPSMHKRIVLVDLGLATSYRITSQADEPPVSPGYSPPEQYTGHTEPASDFYALGATIVCMLTGQRPPSATERSANDLQALLAGVSPAMQAVIERLMALEIAQRYADLDSIRADLEQTPELSNNLPIWHPSELARPLAESTERHASAQQADPAIVAAPRIDKVPARIEPGRARWPWAALLVLLALVAGGVYRWMGGAEQAGPAVSGGVDRPVAAVTSPSPGPAASQAPGIAAPGADGTVVSPTPGITSTAAATAVSTPTPTLLPTAAPALAEIEGRITFFSEQGISIFSAGRSEQNISAQSGDTSPRWSPSGTQIGFVSQREGNRDVFVMDADGSNLQQLTTNPADDVYPAWSPDGQEIAFVSQRDGVLNVYCIDVVRRTERRLTENTNTTVKYEDLAWASDGTLAAAVQRNNVWNIHLLDQRGADRPVTTNPNPFTVQMRAPAWHPDSTQLAFMSDVGGAWNVYVASLSGESRPITRNTDQSIYISQPTWSPDGRQLSFISRSIVTQGDRQAYRYSINVVAAETEGAAPRPVLVDDTRLDDPDWVR